MRLPVRTLQVTNWVPHRGVRGRRTLSATVGRWSRRWNAPPRFTPSPPRRTVRRFPSARRVRLGPRSATGLPRPVPHPLVPFPPLWSGPRPADGHDGTPVPPFGDTRSECGLRCASRTVTSFPLLSPRSRRSAVRTERFGRLGSVRAQTAAVRNGATRTNPAPKTSDDRSHWPQTAVERSSYIDRPARGRTTCAKNE